MGFVRRFIGSGVIKSESPPTNINSQWVDTSTSTPIIKMFNQDTKEWTPITSGSEIKFAQNIVERDSLDKKDGFIVFVIDATLDSTVNSGWAQYIALNNEWIKTGEGESLDIATGGVIDTISANKVIETIDKKFVTLLEKSQIENNNKELLNKMSKSFYDSNDDGVVNDSDKLGGQLPSFYAKQSDLSNKSDILHSHRLSDLSDIDQTSKADKKILQWNSTANTHEYVDIVSGGSSDDISADNIIESTTKKVMTSDERTKLFGIEEGANNYIHPSTHPATIIEQDVNNRFVTDEQILEWNSKATINIATINTNGLMSSTDKIKLDSISQSGSTSSSIFDFYKQFKNGKKIIMVGDSTSEAAPAMYNRFSDYYTKIGGLLEGATVINRGVSGGRLNQFINGTLTKYNINTIIAEQADLYVLCYGINDIRMGARTFQQIKDDLKIAIDRLLSETSGYILLRTPNTFLTVDSKNHISPISKSQEYSDQLWEIYQSFKDYSARVDVIDIQSLIFGRKSLSSNPLMLDAIHPSDSGYNFIADIIAERVSNTELVIERDFKNYDLITLGSIISIDSNSIAIQPNNLEIDIKVDDVLILGKSYSFLIKNTPIKNANIWSISDSHIGDYSHYGVVKILRKKNGTLHDNLTASQIQILDSNNLFNSSFVEDVLVELFTYANNIKSSVVSAVGSPLDNSDTAMQIKSKIQLLKKDFANNLANKGVITSASSQLKEMIDKIPFIQNITVEGSVKTLPKLNVTAPYSINVELTTPINPNDILTQIIEYVSGANNVVQYQVSFDNSDATDFEPNENITFDGKMRLKNEWELNLVTDNSWSDGILQYVDVDSSGFTETIGIIIE